MLIGIFICTFNRNKQLINLLNSILISLEKFKNECPDSEVHVEINIIDNSVDKHAYSAIKYYNKFQNIFYYNETKRGISFARNKAIAIAKEKKLDYMIFLDDDEIVSEQWFFELIKKVKKYPNKIISGPVVRSYEEGIDEWVKASRLWERKNFEDECTLDFCGTGNVCIPLAILLETNQIFDIEFAKSGGEDTKFFYELVKKGYKIIWCRQAIVYEPLVKERATIKYLIRNEFRNGANYTRLRFVYEDNRKSYKIIGFLKALVHIVVSLLLVFPAVFMGRKFLIKNILRFSKGLGQMCGLFNISINHY